MASIWTHLSHQQPELHSVDSDTCFEVKWSGGEGTVNMNKIVGKAKNKF